MILFTVLFFYVLFIISCKFPTNLQTSVCDSTMKVLMYILPVSDLNLHDAMLYYHCRWLVYAYHCATNGGGCHGC